MLLYYLEMMAVLLLLESYSMRLFLFRLFRLMNESLSLILDALKIESSVEIFPSLDRPESVR